jgi:sec-independent protein translocase protein TatA
MPRYHAGMPSIGPLELAIVLIIALVIFGPKRLPELGRSVGHGLREFKSSISGDNDEEPRTIDNGIEDDDGATPVAEARADTAAQTAAPAASRADAPPASRTGD